MLINHALTVGSTPVDLVGSGVDLDRPYELHVSCDSGSAFVGDSSVTVSSGLPLQLPGATRATLVFRVGDHGNRFYAVGDGTATVRVLAVGL